jgi:hypothetical protein
LGVAPFGFRHGIEPDAGGIRAHHARSAAPVSSL